MGYIKGAHGIRGETFAIIPSFEWDWAKPGRQLYLKKRDDQTSDFQVFEIARFKEHKNGLIIKFKEVPDRNMAETMRGFVLYLEKEHFVSRPGEKIFLNEVMNFKVFNAGGLVGTVVGFMDNGAHDLIKVKDQDSEHLIPFVEPFIKEINFESGEIHMELPEGLI